MTLKYSLRIFSFEVSSATTNYKKWFFIGVFGGWFYLLYSTVQYSTVQYSRTVQYSTLEKKRVY